MTRELEVKNKKLLEYNNYIKHEQELVNQFSEWGQAMSDLDSDYV
jgi:hypothetical protein